MIKPEILAPAGGTEQLCAAVRAGADAVYLGYGSLSARAGAQNPVGDELRRAVEYCRMRGVRLYVAMNTLIRDDEWRLAQAATMDICKSGADGVIVQDPGVARMFLQCAPDMPVHGSTQMSVHSPAGAQLLEKAGLKRVVLAREMSKKEIEQVIASSNIETEVFVHGAMCMSVSGQCYLSSVLGSRSGNRGMCAQPCRLPFSARGSQGYDLSLKDMSLVEHIPLLAQMGVTSLKIEGRLKRPEYIAAAVAACRMAADGQQADPNLLKNLEAVFSRSGFSDGYFTGKRGKIMFGYRRKDDVLAASSKVFGELHNLYREEKKSVEIGALLTAKVGEPLALEVWDGENKAFASGDIVVAAEKPHDAEQRIRQQICKTGGTPYVITRLDIETDGEPFVPVSAINNLRRSALEVLSEKRSRVIIKDFTEKEQTYEPHAAGTPTVRAIFSDISEIPENAKKCDFVFIPAEACENSADEVKDLIRRGFNAAVTLPGANFGSEEKIVQLLDLAKESGIKDVLVQNLGQIIPAKNAGMTLHGGFRLNIANSNSLDVLRQQGVEDACVSFELTFNQINALGGKFKRGILAYGHLPLMITRNCPSANGTYFCDRCGGKGQITDRRGDVFEVRCRMGCSELYNPVPMCVFDKLGTVKADFFDLLFTTEDKNKAKEIIDLYFEGKKPEGKLTNGLYLRGME